MHRLNSSYVSWCCHQTTFPLFTHIDHEITTTMRSRTILCSISIEWVARKAANSIGFSLEKDIEMLNSLCLLLYNEDDDGTGSRKEKKRRIVKDKIGILIGKHKNWHKAREGEEERRRTGVRRRRNRRRSWCNREKEERFARLNLYRQNTYCQVCQLSPTYTMIIVDVLLVFQLNYVFVICFCVCVCVCGCILMTFRGEKNYYC